MSEEREAPSLGELIEATMIAVPYPGVWVKLAPRPAPGYPAMVANLVGFWTLGLAIRVVREVVAGTQGIELGLTLAPAGLAVVAATCFSLPGAVVLHGASRLAGGTGPFQRSYQIVSMISSVAVIDALLSFAPGLWWVRALLAAWLMHEGVQAFHGAPVGRARAVFATMGVLAVVGQHQAQKATEAMLVRHAGGQLAEAMNNAIPVLNAEAPRPGSGSIEFLKAPSGEPTMQRQPEFNAPPEDRMPQVDDTTAARYNDPQMDQAQAAAASMFDALIPMLKAARNKKGMSRDQMQQLDMVIGMIERQKQTLLSNKPMTEAEQKKQFEDMQKIQAQITRFMMANPAPEPNKRETK